MARTPNTDLTLLEQQVMLAALRLHPRGYGVTIQEEIESRAKRSMSLGSIYAALSRLEQKGFMETKEGEATQERGGRRKTYFTLTGVGRRALDESMNAIDRLRHDLPIGEVAR
ncbi:putative Transcriptional regulator,PadR-like family [uncultured Pleomorphomonas sp.]|uniref:Putative Transcriptional regulator,PadR-like family n=1 Tax=uncultured Pleomorphomonas sp. TaxID=442121 RepID=A0A212L216_9HYPH|nr:helix-turn-helix transcriptional regulator [uncultured Pleomorphomonas sp.]SCM71593.1 putative Transcriptional regulator,PadR-like family [uncultured Pleomorphomonas sp.]